MKKFLNSNLILIPCSLFMLELSSCSTAADKDFDCSTIDNSVSSVFQQCTNDHSTDPFNSNYTETLQGTQRVITCNSVPNHNYGAAQDKMSEVNLSYTMPLSPSLAGTTTNLLGQVRIDYVFGIGLNGVKMDPEANFPYENTSTGEQNYGWMIEALNNSGLTVNNRPLNLDCNQAHLQATGAYHYHGDFPDFGAIMGANSSNMAQVGWAADGFPIFYKYAYNDASDSNSPLIEMTSSYSVKAGERPGDGISAPCGTFNGKYEQDYEYVPGLGTLDECNGRSGPAPGFPGGTYYYVITADFPAIPRCFKGTPDDSFRV